MAATGPALGAGMRSWSEVRRQATAALASTHAARPRLRGEPAKPFLFARSDPKLTYERWAILARSAREWSSSEEITFVYAHKTMKSDDLPQEGPGHDNFLLGRPDIVPIQGHGSLLEYESVEPEDGQSPPETDCGLILRGCLSGAQSERLNALIQKVKPETVVFVAVMKNSDVQSPRPLLIISKERTLVEAAQFPHENGMPVTLQIPDKSEKWHPRFYMEKGEGMLAGGNVSPESDIHGFPHDSLDGKDTHSSEQPSLILPWRTSLTTTQRKIVDEKCQAIGSKYRLYVATLNSSSLQKKQFEFGQDYAHAVHLPAKTTDVILKSNGKDWETKMSCRKGNNNSNRWMLVSGWGDFMRGNEVREGGLVDGDMLLFELQSMNEKEITMEVHVVPRENL
ncbi:hypothetical protein VPH35_012701 [Triticum aestivum]|uniref:B3 domain-containing protein Os03g0620400 n=1 Tax=Triticum aestivum TaxID=4565 RepID=UPI001D01238F|nr:B3 domain-containing protein Os03g0620400-like [Triticum aestivum]